MTLGRIDREVLARRCTPIATLALTSLVTLLMLAQTSQRGFAVSLQETVETTSPAGGHAAVIAQGVATMPADDLAWRIVRDSAEPLSEAEPRERALGFSLADGEPILVNDIGAGTQTRLAAGEAAFVAEGAQQERASLSDAPVPYYRIALVPTPQATETDDDDLIFASDGFSAPPGEAGRDIDLVRDVLAGGESTALPAFDAPTVILSTLGTVQITAETGESVSLSAGEAIAVTGELTVGNDGETDASFVAAMIGSEVPPLDDGPSDLTLAVWACPDGLEADAVRTAVSGGDDATLADCAAAASDFETTVTTPDDDELTLADAEEVETGVYRWDNLGIGDFTLGEPTTLPAFYSDGVAFVAQVEVVDGELALTADDPSVRADLYLLRTGAGVVTLQGRVCPEGMTADTLEPDLCAPSDDALAVRLLGGDNGGDILTTDDAEYDGRTYRWDDVAVAPGGEFSPEDFYSYVVRLDDVPAGFDDALLDGPDPDGDAADATFHLHLTADAPRADLTLYLFQATGAGGDGTGGAGASDNGSISLVGHPCPAADSPAEVCLGSTIALTGASLQAEDSGEILTLADAARNGDTYVWANLPQDTYFFLSADLTPPTGYDIVRIEGGAGSVSDSYAVNVNPTRPDVLVEVYLSPSGGDESGGSPPDPAPDPDTDGDGLTDSQEASYGTDSTLSDTDGDGVDDGTEINMGTNPLGPDGSDDGTPGA